MQSEKEIKISPGLSPFVQEKYDYYVNLIARRIVLANKKLKVNNLERVLDNDPCMIAMSHNAHAYDIAATIAEIPRTIYFTATSWLYSSKDARRLIKQFLQRRFRLGGGVVANSFYYALLPLSFGVSKFVSSRIKMFEQIPVKVKYGTSPEEQRFDNRRATDLIKEYLKAGRTVVLAPRNQERIPSEYSDFVCNDSMSYCESGTKYCYIAINTALSECCWYPEDNPCPNGAWKTDISGTGYSCAIQKTWDGADNGSSTGWLVTRWTIEPNEEFDIVFHIHDTSDHQYDSEVILDGFFFLAEVDPGTVPVE